jgi:hypothetical protein
VFVTAGHFHTSLIFKYSVGRSIKHGKVFMVKTMLELKMQDNGKHASLLRLRLK